MNATLDTLSRSRTADFRKYRTDPSLYCREVLGVALTPQQDEICAALIKHRWILVPSANETGKSFIEACLASWHYDCFNPGRTIVTGPVADQIRDTVFAELRAMRPAAGFAPAAMRLSTDDMHWVKGFTARSATAFQGRHTGSVFVIFEEAEEIESEFWVAADSMAHYFAAFYNPISTSSETAIRERSDKYHIVRLSALDHPNIAAGLAGRLPPVPKAITLDRLLDRLDRWATRLTGDEPGENDDISVAGRRYRPGPIAEARILGRRPSQSVGSVFSQAHVTQLLATRQQLLKTWPVVIGCDVARFGDDHTVMHVRQGLCSLHHESHNGWRETMISDRIRELCYQYGRETVGELRVKIQIDDSAYGGGTQDMLIRDRYNVVPIDARSSKCNPEFPNIRSQLWFDAVDCVKNGLVDISRLTPEQKSELTTQLLAPKYQFDKKGRREVEQKKVTKANLHRSPDDADAFNLAYFNPTPMTETYQ
jgi:hypothetical protein